MKNRIQYPQDSRIRGTVTFSGLKVLGAKAPCLKCLHALPPPHPHQPLTDFAQISRPVRPQIGAGPPGYPNDQIKTLTYEISFDISEGNIVEVKCLRRARGVIGT